MESVNLRALTKTEIFAGATEEEVSSMLNCLSAKKKKYQKDEIIFHAGDIVSSIGVMLKGNALIENDDIWGNRSVLDYVKEGQIVFIRCGTFPAIFRQHSDRRTERRPRPSRCRSSNT